MKKLEDFPKRVNYKVPDGYFDDLPTRIQSRISTDKGKSWRFNLGFSLRLAIPLVVLLAVGIVWYDRSNDSLSEQLEDIDESALALFLDDADLVSDEPAEDVSWSSEDLDALEGDVYDALDPAGTSLDVTIDELDLENL